MSHKGCLQKVQEMCCMTNYDERNTDCSRRAKIDGDETKQEW